MGLSETTERTDRALAYSLMRLVLGVNILMHGVSRIVAGTSGFAHSLLPEFQKTPLPAPLVYAFGLTLPIAEMVLGGLLLFGFWTRYACVLGLLLLAALTFGSALSQNWSVTGIQLIYAAVYAALLGLRRYNRFSVDAWIFWQKD